MKLVRMAQYSYHCMDRANICPYLFIASDRHTWKGHLRHNLVTHARHPLPLAIPAPLAFPFLRGTLDITRQRLLAVPLLLPRSAPCFPK